MNIIGLKGLEGMLNAKIAHLAHKQVESNYRDHQSIQCPGILGLFSLRCAQQDAGEYNEAQCRLGLHLHTQPILLHGDVHQRFLVWSITCVQGNHQRGLGTGKLNESALVTRATSTVGLSQSSF